MSFYEKTMLPNGLRVVTESIPHVRSVSVGVWVGVGSCTESASQIGISHLIEHMLFKGTPTRSARQLAQAIDGRGGTLNAFTAKEYTCYYAKVLDEHVSVAVDVLADMIQRSLFDQAELTKEKGVIVEEIKMYEDVPDDLVHDLFSTAVWPDHALGRPIVGTEPIVQGFSRDEILAYFYEHYTAGNMLIAAAGNISHDQIVQLVQAAFSEVRPTDTEGSAKVIAAVPTYPNRSHALLRVKDTEQTHIVVGTRGLETEHPDLYALHLLNTVLGGGTSSRLFQEIREDRGLAYSVYSFQSSFRDAGTFAVYAGVSPKVTLEVLELIHKAFVTMGNQGVTPEELHEAKEQLKGQIMLGLESTSGRMTRLGRGELTVGRVYGPDEVIRRIDQVSLDQVVDLGRQLLIAEPKVMALVGPTTETEPLYGLGYQEVTHG